MKFKLDVPRWLAVVNVYDAAGVALLALLAVQVARLAWVVVTPVAPLGEWRPVGPTIPAMPGDVLQGPDPFYPGGGAGEGRAIVTSLNLTLFGTRINEASGRGSAIVAGPDGVQKSVSVGEEIAPGVVLKEVAFDHITITRGGGAAEDLFLDQSGGGAPSAPLPGPVAGAPPAQPGGPITIQHFQSEIGFVPRIDSGRVIGLVARPQGPGTAFRAAGLKEGDIITAIGGRPVNSPADFELITSSLKDGGTLSLTVQRDGQSVNLSAPVAPR
ncbi:MAG: type II secretion system protein N [Sphingomonas bacterium]